jgi:glyoxylase-like metal-dependent hydrolase (beta-lactamase superfamily II)
MTGATVAISKNSKAKHSDQYLKDGDTIGVGKLALKCLETPGHTDGCMSFYGEDVGVFTGDALLIRGCGRTDFQQGSPAHLFHSIKEKLFKLPSDTRVFPGHDYNGHLMSTIGEEKQFNPRVGGEANETDFVHYMKNLNLPHPKQMAEAVPANVESGKLAAEFYEQTQDFGEALVSRTLNGHYEVRYFVF